MMRDVLRGLRCNALLGDAHSHIHYDVIRPSASGYILFRQLAIPLPAANAAILSRRASR